MSMREEDKMQCEVKWEVCWHSSSYPVNIVCFGRFPSTVNWSRRAYWKPATVAPSSQSSNHTYLLGRSTLMIERTILLACRTKVPYWWSTWRHRSDSRDNMRYDSFRLGTRGVAVVHAAGFSWCMKRERSTAGRRTTGYFSGSWTLNQPMPNIVVYS